MRFPLLFITSLILLSSCRKQEITEIDQETPDRYSWQAHNGFQYDDVNQMNSLAGSDRLFFIGSNSFSVITPETEDQQNDPSEFDIARYTHTYFIQPHHVKLPLSETYYISYNPLNNTIAFTSTQNPAVSGDRIYFSMKELDETFSNFRFIHFNTGQSMAINSENQALIPYTALIDGREILKLALVDIKGEREFGQIALDTVKTNIITIVGNGYAGLTGVHSFGEDFFVTTDAELYRIDKNGVTQRLLDEPLNRILRSGSTLFGISSQNIYASANNGLTWNILSQIPSDFSRLNYAEIDQRIIAYRYAQLWEITLEETRLTVRELDNEGLSGKMLTSVNEFGRHVYLSTLSGVF